MLTNEYEYEVDIQTKTEEAFEKGTQQGEQKKAEESAIELLKEKVNPELIAKCVKLPIEKVLELQKQINK